MMRVIVLGGTRFIGRAIAGALTAAGHAVLVAHRGMTEPAGLPAVEHLHAGRGAWPGYRAAFAAFGADAAVDVSAGNGPDARAALAALPPGIRLVALSSVDVYRAYEALRSGTQTDPVPLTEESPLRAARHIDGPQWENLDIEEAYLAAGATILRLGAVYGEHDYQRRFEPALRRVRAGRPRLPVGAGSFLGSRVYAGDVAEAALAALGTRRATRAPTSPATTTPLPLPGKPGRGAEDERGLATVIRPPAPVDLARRPGAAPPCRGTATGAARMAGGPGGAPPPRRCAASGPARS